MSKFTNLGLNPEIIRAITDMGFEIPMPVQEQVIPVVLEEDRDIVALAQTGTGKTAAFGLPLINRINPSVKKVQALILCPTRELCLQISDDLTNYAKYMPNMNVLAVYGGSSIENQMRAIKHGVHIIVATPGRMLDLIRRKAVNLDKVNTVVLDEADEMLNMGFIESLDNILKVVPPDRRTLLFSATMPNEVAKIAGNYMQNPKEITIGTKNSSSENVKHICYIVNNRDRYLALKRIADYNPNVYGIVFCRTRKETQEIADKLITDGYSADALHGDLSQAQRDYVMQKFRVRNIRLLVATDVAARGLDVTDLTHVINYNLPDEIEIYNHRSGRTGRAGKTGTSVLISSLKDKGKVKQIEKSINKKFEFLDVPKGREICEKQLFHFIDRMENVEVDNSQINTYLPEIFFKLEHIDKEEVIRRFVSLEFNRFLNYYRDAADIDTAAVDDDRRDKRDKRGDKRDKKSDRDRSDRNDRSDRYDRDRYDRDDKEKASRKAEKGFTRLHINAGKKDGLYPNVLIQLINQADPGNNIKIGKIDLTKKDTYFEVESGQAKSLLKKLKNVYYMNKKVEIKAL